MSRKCDFSDVGPTRSDEAANIHAGRGAAGAARAESGHCPLRARLRIDVRQSTVSRSVTGPFSRRNHPRVRGSSESISSWRAVSCWCFFSRDQDDTAGSFKRLTSGGVSTSSGRGRHHLSAHRPRALIGCSPARVWMRPYSSGVTLVPMDLVRRDAMRGLLAARRATPAAHRRNRG